ncbi:MAG: hypothetical protein N4A59_14570, partial [Marinifilum sp.]|nr:hypothetical protein [Marinifilum sp.]
MKKLLLSLSILFCVLFVHAQELRTKRDTLKKPLVKSAAATKSAGGSSSGGLAPVSMPIMPSPTAASLVRNATASPNLYTGAVNVSVPLYTLPAQGMNIPIGLVYQTNGVKVNEKNGPLGMTWSLQGGGAVARIVRGYPDEFKGKLKRETWTNSAKKHKEEVEVKGYWYNKIPADYKTNNESYEAVMDHIRGKDKQIWDTEPDKYLFSAPGLVGSFYIPEKSKAPVIHCDADIDIQTHFVDGVLKGFVITSASGVCYEFGMQKNYIEKQTFETYSKLIEARHKQVEDMVYETNFEYETPEYTSTFIEEEKAYQSVWYLKKIITPFSADIVYFFYDEDDKRVEKQPKSFDAIIDNPLNDYKFVNNEKTKIEVSRVPLNVRYISQKFIEKQNLVTIFKPKQLTSIVSNAGKIDIRYSKKEKGRRGSSGYSINMINKLVFYGTDKKSVIKTINLDYKLAESNISEPYNPLFDRRASATNTRRTSYSKRYFLNTINEVNRVQSDTIQLFSFSYEKPEFLPAINSYSQNRYG